jgi:hypothetical protein
MIRESLTKNDIDSRFNLDAPLPTLNSDLAQLKVLEVPTGAIEAKDVKTSR